MSKKLSFDEFIQIARTIHGDKYDYSVETYVNSHTKMTVICPVHGSFLQTPKKHIRSKQGCRKCYEDRNQKHRRTSPDDFIKKAKEIHKDEYTYDKIIYVNTRTPVLITCAQHGDFQQTPARHLSGDGCPVCRYVKMASSNTSLQDDVIKKFREVHSDQYDYSLIKYVSIREKVEIICKKHGVFQQTPNNHIHGAGCPTCRASKGELFIRQFFQNKGINFISQMKFPDCRLKKSLPFDFYLPEINTCIEYDGLLHFKPKFGQESLDKTQRNDKIKTKFCQDKGIKLIRVSYMSQDLIADLEKGLEMAV